MDEQRQFFRKLIKDALSETKVTMLARNRDDIHVSAGAEGLTVRLVNRDEITGDDSRLKSTGSQRGD
jgi:uncharacterized ubiquitin-like protein YukD